MIEDRNKTEITCKATSAAALYLCERGCKPLESEVHICKGWTADLAAVLAPTITELVKLKLLRPRPRTRLVPGLYSEWWNEGKALQRVMTVVVEVKTTRADFCGDKKWEMSIPADLAYLTVPKGLLSSDEWPNGWGILEYNEQSSTVRCGRPPELRQASSEQHITRATNGCGNLREDDGSNVVSKPRLPGRSMQCEQCSTSCMAATTMLNRR